MKKKLSLTSKIFIAMGVGLSVGILVRSLPAGTVKDTIIIGGVFKVNFGYQCVKVLCRIVQPVQKVKGRQCPNFSNRNCKIEVIKALQQV